MDLQTLLDNGVIVLPGPSGASEGLKEFLEDNHVEFKDGHPDVMGNFGAWGHPTSFHHPFIRGVRAKVYSHMAPKLREIFPGKKIEMLFDRFSKRKAGTSTVAESWHRDITSSKNFKENDIIYGGWINLDKTKQKPQYFSCIPGTHIYEKDKKKGFAVIDKEQVAVYKKMKKDKIVKPFEIQPGHMILFNQDIAHEVLSRKTKEDSYRLYIGWRITDDEKPLYDNLMTIIERQGIPTIPGGMLPPMYAKMHIINWNSRVIDFTTRIKDEFIDGKYVMRYMVSLKKSGLQMLPAYTDDEINILQPFKLK